MAPGGWASPAFPLKRTTQAHSSQSPNNQAPDQGSQLPPSPERGRQGQINPNGAPNASGDPYDADAEDCVRGDDPRIPVHAPPNRTTKSHQQKLVHSMIRHFLDHKMLLNEAPEGTAETRNQAPPSLPSLPPSPDPTTVKDYLSFHNAGPSSERPLLLWAEPMTHPWNARLVQLLSSTFVDYAKDKQLLKLIQILGDDIQTPHLIASRLEGIADIPKLIHDKLSSHRSECLAALRKVEKMKALSMTTPEIMARLNTTKQGRKDQLRRNERKKLLYCRRHEIIEVSLLKPTTLNDPEAIQLWEQISQFFTIFTHDDMSSDETEAERTYLVPKSIRRVRRYWIHDDVTQVFHFIDSCYSPFTMSGSHKRGSPPLVRCLESHKVNTKCTPRAKLPKNVYSDDILPEAREFLLPQPSIAIPNVPKVSRTGAQHDTVDSAPMDTNY